MVVLSFQVTDNKGHYVNGLKPTDFRIFEDGILQQVATFAEGAKAPLAVGEDGTTRPLLEANKEALPGMERPDAFVGTNVFVLFDTSNFMYKGFVYAEDAIADFVRGLDRADSIAVYTFSRNLSRASALTRDHSERHRRTAQECRRRRYGALQRPAAGPARRRQSARPQGRHRLLQRPRQRQHGGARRRPRRGRRRRHSDLRHLHQPRSTRIPISSNVFKRISQRTGGKAYFAKTWQKQVEAFEDIREDLGNSYTVTYYPKANPNEGFRKITIDPTNDPGKKWRIRSRPGYRPSRVL